MNLEWIRPRCPEFDANLREYLFKSGPIVALEAEACLATPKPALPAPGESLGLGALREAAPAAAEED